MNKLLVVTMLTLATQACGPVITGFRAAGASGALNTKGETRVIAATCATSLN